MLKLEAEVNGIKKVKSQLNYLLISKKKQSIKTLVRKLEVNGKEICHQAKINDEIKILFEEIFKCQKGKSFTNLSNILNTIDLPCLTNEENNFCEIGNGEN